MKTTKQIKIDQLKAELKASNWNPTPENQEKAANLMLFEQGRESLRQHAMIGATCNCGTCFCCKAQIVYNR